MLVSFANDNFIKLSETAFNKCHFRIWYTKEKCPITVLLGFQTHLH